MDLSVPSPDVSQAGATATRRAKQLSARFASSPVLPMLGTTKVVETLVAGGPTVNWAAFTGAVTALWVFGDTVRRRMDEAVHFQGEQ